MRQNTQPRMRQSSRRLKWTRISQGGHVYNIDYDRKPPNMLYSQLTQDTRINENRNRELKEKNIREVEK